MGTSTRASFDVGARIGAAPGASYDVVRVLGTGAMGQVLEARRAADDAVFAIKTLLLSSKDDAGERRARFDREIAVCKKLGHANLVGIVDHGLDDVTGTPYLVMPLLTGLDLAAALKALGRAEPLEPAVAVSLVVQACNGVEAAHAAGVVHRDIKPSNLFLEETAPGAPLRVRVTDFGLAKVHGELTGLTASGAFMGTAYYAAPEQAVDAKQADEKSDVWSLAMTLYHALAGAPAFARTGGFMAFLVSVAKEGGVPPLQDLAPWIPPRLARTVHGALLRDPARRCPSAVELRLGLEMALGWDASHRAVHRADLAAASAATRAAVQPKAALPRAWIDLLRG